MSADAGTGHRPPGSPLAVPGFRWLWSGGLVSLAGTQMQRVALPYFVHEQTGSSFATALCAAAQVLPGITLAPLAGSLADRGDPRRLLIGADVVLTAVTLAFCLALVAPWWVVVVVAFLQASVAQLVAPAEAVLRGGGTAPGGRGRRRELRRRRAAGRPDRPGKRRNPPCGPRAGAPAAGAPGTAPGGRRVGHGVGGGP